MNPTKFLFRQSKTNRARYLVYLADGDVFIGIVTRREIVLSGKRNIDMWTAKTIAGKVLGTEYNIRNLAAQALASAL